jgi:hypothetical protein
MLPLRLTAPALMLVLAGCATLGSEGREGRPGNLNELTREEIRSTQHNNLFDVVQALRPTWLQQRGQISVSDPTAGQVRIYLNDVQMGGAAQLQHINVLDVTSIRYLDAAQASARFGIRQRGGGAILVRTIADA